MIKSISLILAKKVKTKDIVMTKIVQNASELLSELSQITPMGPVTQVQEDKISDLGITPPSQQLDPQKMVQCKVPFRVHERVGKWLDKILGPSVPIKWVVFLPVNLADRAKESI